MEQVNVPKRNNSQTQIVCLDQVAAYDLDESNSSPTKKALQTVEQNGEDMAVSTYVPYTVDESTGELVNSFAYAASLKEDEKTREIPSNLVDVILRTTAQYTLLSDGVSTIYYYRHSAIKSTWTGASSGQIVVTNLYASYITQGDLKAYPDCVQTFAPVLQSNYTVESLVNKVNPVMGTTYSDTSHAMPYNRAVHMADYFEHGGFVYVKVNYYNRSTGQSKMADATYRIYSKSSEVS